MTGLFGWLPRDGADPSSVMTAMACALQSHGGEAWAWHAEPGCAVGVLDGIDPSRVEEWAAPAWSPDARHALWLAGEIFEAQGLDGPLPQEAPSAPVRRRLLEVLRDHGPEVLRRVDGDYQIAWWDGEARTLTLLSDRHGGRAWYWAATPSGVAFACGVRGVLLAPGVSSEPDLVSLRDATTFGGYRLGGHTNVSGVRMFPGALRATLRPNGILVGRYWRWTEIGERPDVTLDDAVEGAAALWRHAMRRHLRGAAPAGLTLSGGLDSRLVLAEAAAQGVPLAAVTYGLPGSEDERYAQRAARTAGVSWCAHPLYDGDWLATRSAAIQRTDGLIQLGDLMHLEALPTQHAHFATHLSGYAGDAVAGATFGAVNSLESAMLALPYYATPLSRGWDGALARLEEATESRDLLDNRFLVFEHKLAQSTRRWSDAWRPWLRVRRPFMDTTFFDHCQSLPWDLRGRQRMYEVWLRRHYPDFFARIPNQKTGAPVLAAGWQLHAARVRRVLRRSWLRTARVVGLPHRPWHRSYFDDERQWAAPAVRHRITETILRPGSMACDAFGRDAVASLLEAWFTRGAAPAQVVGALYTFEAYHAGLAAHLAAARAAAVQAGRHQGAARC
jgi:hypothetical protein